MRLLNRIRLLNTSIFKYSPIPSDIRTFINRIENIDTSTLDWFSRSFESYKIKESFSDIPKLKITAKHFIYGVIYVCLYIYSWFMKKPKYEEGINTIYYKISENENIIPETVLEDSRFAQRRMSRIIYFDETAKSILKQCFIKSKSNFSFLFHVFFPLGNYSYIINNYHPKKIITTYESLTTISVMTYYCRLMGVRHINYMHGEKIISQNNTLGEFDEMYVWDDYYIELFEKLKYSCREYKIYNPWNTNSLPKPEREIDYTFYLNNETRKNLKLILNYVSKLIKHGYSVKIRPHPSQYEEIISRNLLPCEFLECYHDVNILQSISNTRYAVSRFSTVLFQAHCYGKKIVIDDCTVPHEYDRLKLCGFIMTKKEHMLLSNIMENME